MPPRFDKSGGYYSMFLGKIALFRIVADRNRVFLAITHFKAKRTISFHSHSIILGIIYLTWIICRKTLEI